MKIQNKNHPGVQLILSLTFTYLMSYFSLSAAFADKAQETTSVILAPDMHCGKIKLKGRLSVNSSGLTLMKLYPETTQEYEVAILGFPIDSLMKLQGLLISMEGEVIRSSDKEYPRINFKQLGSVISEKVSQTIPVEQISTTPCTGIKS